MTKHLALLNKKATEFVPGPGFRISIFFADPDPDKNLHADPDPGGYWGVSGKMNF